MKVSEAAITHLTKFAYAVMGEDQLGKAFIEEVLRQVAGAPEPASSEEECPETALLPLAVKVFEKNAHMRTTASGGYLAITRTYRAAVVLRDHLGLSYKAAADICGVVEGTIKSRVNRGRVAIKSPKLRKAAA